MIAEGIDGVLVELEVSIAFLGHGARVEEDHPIQVEFQPGRGTRVLVVLDDVHCQLGGDDACVAEPTQVHLLVLQLGELLIETEDGPVVLLLSHVVSDGLLHAVREADACWSFDVEDIGLLVPIVGVAPEVGRVAGEDELTLGVQPAVETGAAWARGDDDNERVLGGIVI